MSADIESVVIGAGVVGLAVARALALQGHEVLVIERHGRIGTEASSRSSEVIHAGLYYPPGSLRASLCVKGRELLYAFAREHAVAHVARGKLLVATRDEDVPALEAIAARAAQNGVADLVCLDAAACRAIEPEVRCVAAYLSPSTGVIDSHGLMQALEAEILAAGSNIVLATTVTAIARYDDIFALATDSQGQISTLKAKNVIVAGGLGASELGKSIGGKPGYRVPETYPARGHYYALAGSVPFSRLVYPLPDGNWLGIHLTVDFAGAAKFGPDLEWQAEPCLAFDDAAGQRRKRFEQEIRRYWPGLPDGALVPGYVGVRPKIYRPGEPAPDFAIHGASEHGHPGLVALYGIESPGLTSCLAIADHVAVMLS